LETLRHLADHIKHPIASAISYCHYTLHDKSLADGTLDYLKARGIGVISASPNSMGLLTPSGPPEWHPSSAQLKERAKAAAAICSKHGVNFARVALGFALSNENSPTIMGSYSKFSEMRENLSLVTGSKPLTVAEKAAQHEILSGPFANLGPLASWEGYEVDKYWIKVGKTLMLQRYADRKSA
jgi:aryl-alcohol dehydrogenase-like predicted oxidoreductase